MINMEETTKLKEDIVNVLPADESSKISYLAEKGFNPFEPHPLAHLNGVHHFKSVWRAMRRGKASVNGEVLPRRPYNNRKPTRGRELQRLARQIYGEYVSYIRRTQAGV